MITDKTYHLRAFLRTSIIESNSLKNQNRTNKNRTNQRAPTNWTLKPDKLSKPNKNHKNKQRLKVEIKKRLLRKIRKILIS